MNYSLYDVTGNIGVVIIIVIYLFLQLGKIESASLKFSLLNAIGAILIIISLFNQFNLSAFVIEVFWLVISLVGVIRFFKVKKDDV